MKQKLFKVKESKRFDFLFMGIIIMMALTSFLALYTAFPLIARNGGPDILMRQMQWYIIGFAAGAFVTGKIAEGMGTKKAQPGFGRLLAANFIGLGIVYLFGMVYYYLICDLYLGTPIGLWPLFLYCFLLAVPGDLLLCILGAVIGKRMIPLIRSSVI